MSRESDIDELCRGVLDIEPDFYDGRCICPWCFEYGCDREGMLGITHDLKCAYSIAKDLMTNKS